MYVSNSILRIQRIVEFQFVTLAAFTYHKENEMIKNKTDSLFFNQMTSAEKIIRADQRKGLIVSEETVRVRQVELKMKLDLWGFKIII